jgi:DNA-directed RNA polymerase subunit RPC12/RpoP
MPLQECDKCKKEILIYANEDNVCPHCGKKYLKSTSNQQAQGTKKIKDLQGTKKTKDLQRVELMEKNKGTVLTDIDLPFSRVLWVSFQFILAGLILAIPIWLTLLFFGLLVGGY